METDLLFFQSYLHSRWLAKANSDETFELVINEVVSKHISMEQESFSVYLRGVAASVLPQGTYTFQRNDITFPMFITPIAAENNSIIYEAVFNRAKVG